MKQEHHSDKTKKQPNKTTFPAVTISFDFIGDLQVHQPVLLVWHILSAFSQWLKMSPGAKRGVRLLEILPTNLWRFISQSFAILKLPIVSSPALFRLVALHMPNHCSCKSYFSVSFQDGRTRSVDAIPDGFCVSILFFSLSCSNKN